VLAAQFGRDLQAGEAAFDQENATNLALQPKLDSINRAHGDTYMEYNLALTS
jgi:hypothetical protein